jgi:hypothetical protein
MGTPTTHIHIAASTRLILAMFRIIAGIEEDFGRAVVDILKKQYPDQNVDINPATVGHRLMSVARKQNQGDDQRAMDAIQDFLAYLVGAGQATEKEVKIEIDDPRSPTGKRPGTKTVYERGDEWNFETQTAKTWQEALDAIYSNVRLRGMSKSMEHMKRKKKEKSIDDAYGKRGEEGGAPEGGEARMPTPAENPLARGLDDQSAIKSFIEIVDEMIPELRKSLSDDTRKLFDLIFFDEVGSFGSDIKENMNQASAMKEKYPELYQKNAKRWSGYVGDLRKKLLGQIWAFVEDNMSDEEMNVLWDEFYSDTTPRNVEKIEEKKVGDKLSYQQGIDERKLARFKWQKENGVLDQRGEVSYRNLDKKLRGQGVDVDAIAPEENPDDKTWKLHTKAASVKPRFEVLQIAARVASSRG